MYPQTPIILIITSPILSRKPVESSGSGGEPCRDGDHVRWFSRASERSAGVKTETKRFSSGSSGFRLRFPKIRATLFWGSYNKP